MIRIEPICRALLFLLVGAFALGDGTVDDPDEAWVRRLEGRVAAWRGVAVEPPLTIEFVDAPTVPTPSPPRGFLGRAAVVEAFGLGPPPSGAAPAGKAAAATGAGRVVVAARAPEVRRRLDLVEAVVRTLLLRHHAAPDPPHPDRDDAALAGAAVLEGEVHWVTSLVVAGEAREIAAALEEADDAAALLDPGPGEPPLARAWRRFLAVDGEAFVRAVHAEGGWSAVDAAVRAPPASTEQVLHPRRAYLAARDAPSAVAPVPLDERLPAGWEIEAETTLGELGTGELLRLAGDPVRAIRVAAGWDGDRARVWRRGEDRILDWTAVFDTPDDAAEAIDGLRKVLQRRYHHSAVGEGFEIAMDDAMTRATATAPNGGVRSCAEREGETVRWIDVGGGEDVGVDAGEL